MKKLLSCFAVLVTVGILYAGSRESHLIVNKESQAVAFTQNIDISQYKNFSLQAIYEDSAPSAFTLTDGVKPTAKITVAPDVAAHLVSAQSQVYVNIRSTTALSAQYVTLNGIKFIAGTDFEVGATTVATAANLAIKIAAHPDFDASYAAHSATVTAKAAEKGRYANGWPAATSSAAKIGVSASAFSAGYDVQWIKIGDVVLTEGTDFTATGNNTTTALAIAAAMNTDTTLSALFDTTNYLAVVCSTGIYGHSNNWRITSSTSAYSITGLGYSGGVDGDILSSTFTEADHGLTTGYAVKYQTLTGTAPQGLVNGTTYYVIKLDDNSFKIASSSANAIAGTRIIVSTFTGSGTGSFTPRPFGTACGTGGCLPSFKFQASNDNSNWTDVTTLIASATYTADGNVLRNVTDFNYKYLRINFLAPHYGGLDLDVYLAGFKE